LQLAAYVLQLMNNFFLAACSLNLAANEHTSSLQLAAYVLQLMNNFSLAACSLCLAAKNSLSLTTSFGYLWNNEQFLYTGLPIS
jgi:hypothetical protein